MMPVRFRRFFCLIPFRLARKTSQRKMRAALIRWNSRQEGKQLVVPGDGMLI